MRLYMQLLFALSALLWAAAPQAGAQTAPVLDGRYASIAVDADSREILHARKIDALRYPASLTKMMTLYLVFDAIEAGDVSLDDKIRVSQTAAAQPPVKLGLRAGQKITLHDAVQALAVKSSNDVAVVLAEHIAGSEARFARLMTEKAQSLGMSRTVYRNASGLPDPYQITTTRDQAKLADNLLRIHRRHYHYFGQETFNYKGRTLRNHNTLLGSVAGVDGFKTGYTRDSGYNLTISAARSGRRIIAIVMGGASGASRDRHMAQLIDRAFGVIGLSPAVISAQPELITASVQSAPAQTFTLRGKNKKTVRVVTGKDGAALSSVPIDKTWQIHLGDHSSPRLAQDALNAALSISGLPPQHGSVEKSPRGYAARFINLQAANAQAGCTVITDKNGPPCFLIAPSG